MLGNTLGSYRIVRELGVGGMGTVYLAELVRPEPFAEAGARVALKIVHPHLLGAPGFFKRFLREAEIGKSVDHPNVVRTYDADALSVADRQYHFLVMEYVSGQTLRQLLDQLSRVPEQLCLHIAREVAAGLAAIHEKGAIHRDLKPENILITPQHQVKIMDLGVARLLEEALRLSGPGEFAGTPLYAAPEQVGGEARQVDDRADLFSLGVVLYELSSGRHPHPGFDFLEVLVKLAEEEPRRLTEIDPDLSPFFAEVVQTLLSKDRVERFDSAEQLALILDAGEASTWWRDRSREIRVRMRRPVRRLRIPRETQLYGREGDLARLRGCYDAARQGDGTVVLIEGEAGIGKSRLVDELVRRLREEGEEPNFIFGSYPPGGAATPLCAWSSAYLEHFGTEGLDETLMRYLRVTPLLVPGFAALLRGEPAPPDAVGLTMDSLQAAFVNATRSLAAEHPTIVLIDDLHFAPPEGLAFFSALALAVREHRVCLVGTSWAGLAESWWADLERLPHVQEIKLSRLSPGAVADLLTDSLCSPATVAELAGRVASHSGGNPLFVFEILRSLKERGELLPARGGRWVVRGRVEEIVIPSTVVRIVQARLAGLEEADRSLLEVASCCGDPFDPLVIADALELPRIQVLRDLARIEREHALLRSVGRRFEFDHPHVREHLYERIPGALRSEYHKVIAMTLQAGAPQTAEREGIALAGSAAAEICSHYLRSENQKGAAPHLAAAVDHLKGTHQHERAIALMKLGLGADFLATGERVGLMIRLAGALQLRGRQEELAAVIEEAMALNRETGDLRRTADLQMQRGKLLESRGEMPAAEEAHHAAVAAAVDSGDQATVVKTLNQLGAHLHRQGRPDGARETYLRAQAIAAEIGDRRSAMAVLGNLGILDWEQGRPEEARVKFEASREFFREAGDLRQEAVVIGLLGLILDDLGRHRDAAEMHARQLEINRDIGYRRGVSIATSNLGDSLRLIGQLTEARHHFEEDERISAEIGDRVGAASSLINIAAIHRQLGENRRALECLRRAGDLAREVASPKEEGLALYHLGTLMVQCNRPRRAGPLLDRALTIFDRIRFRGGEGWALLGRGLARLALLRYAEARDDLARAAEIGAEARLPPLELLARCQLARVRGDPVGELGALLEERNELLEPHERVEAWHAIWKADGGQEYLLRSREKLREFEAPLDRDQVKTLRKGVAIYREIHHAWRAVTGN